MSNVIGILDAWKMINPVIGRSNVIEILGTWDPALSYTW